MLIETRFLETGDLDIYAYASNSEQFYAVEETLRAATVDPKYRPLAPDRLNREGRQYRAPSDSISRLESLLQGRFRQNGQFVPLHAKGNVYACREVTRGRTGARCQEVTASSLSIARVECAIIARQNNWSDGDAASGNCP